jgi:hypothetical protein
MGSLARKPLKNLYIQFSLSVNSVPSVVFQQVKPTTEGTEGTEGTEQFFSEVPLGCVPLAPQHAGERNFVRDRLLADFNRRADFKRIIHGGQQILFYPHST